jgi:tetratricopeptide (TPR) repeat protein
VKHCSILFLTTLPLIAGELETARDAQDRATLDRLAAQYTTAASKSPGAQAEYRAALANSYVAEVAIETGDKNKARAAAETGIASAQRAVAAKPDSAEYHRLLGTLCGQVIPANVLAGLKWGSCAKDEVEKAVKLDPKSAINYVSRGVGYYYLPPAFGGGVESAIKDFQQAIALDAKLDDAHLWLGIALRKSGRNADARRELQKAVDLNPARGWAKNQLAKTPGQ